MNRDHTSLTDEELAHGSQQGSLAAFEELVRRYENRVYGFVSQHFSNHMDAREVTQDTFVRAFQAIQQFDPGRVFAPWLFTIARRKCIDRHRAAQPPCATEFPELTDPNTPHELLAAEDERTALWDTARRCLPDLQYQALWLRYAEEMDLAQIAQVLRKTRIHIKVLLFRARQTLVLRLGSLTQPSRQRASLPFRQAIRRDSAVASGELLPLPGQKEPI